MHLASKIFPNGAFSIKKVFL